MRETKIGPLSGEQLALRIAILLASAQFDKGASFAGVPFEVDAARAERESGVFPTPGIYLPICEDGDIAHMRLGSNWIEAYGLAKEHAAEAHDEMSAEDESAPTVAAQPPGDSGLERVIREGCGVYLEIRRREAEEAEAATQFIIASLNGVTGLVGQLLQHEIEQQTRRGAVLAAQQDAEHAAKLRRDEEIHAADRAVKAQRDALSLRDQLARVEAEEARARLEIAEVNRKIAILES